jgi:hypothetical protein
MRYSTVLFTALLSVFALNAAAQDEIQPRKSPFWSTTHTVDDTYIKVTYGRPHKRERVVFGPEGLVKYGEIWRTGANESTELTVTRDIKIGGQKLHAGTYSLYTIPGEKEWVIIINGDLGHWGTSDYKQEHDVLRITVPVAKSDVVFEPFTIEFQNKEGGKKFDMVLVWDTVKVVVPIEVF